MPLAALIAAQEQTDIGDGLRATLPLAGRTLVEYQARLALAAGAGHVVVLVERVPASLARAVDRLRRQGHRIEVARSVADALDRLHPEERILLIADGAIAAQGAVDSLAAVRGGPAVLTLPDRPEHDSFERIDAEERWAGFALCDKAVFDMTAQMLGDWDLSSTILRQLLQKDAARIHALNPTGGEVLPAPVLAVGSGAIGMIEQSLARRADPAGGNWVERHVHRFAAARLMRPLVDRRIDPQHVGAAAAATAWVAVLFAACGLAWPAALLLPLAALAASTARRMAQMWGDAPPHQFVDMARHGAAFAVLVLLVLALAADGGWGWWLVAAMIPLALAGHAALETILGRIRPLPRPIWLPSADALVWLAPFAALAGGWPAMVALLAIYAGVGFVQRFIMAWQAARATSS